MKLKNRKETIARMYGVGKSRILFDPGQLAEIKKAITKSDIRSLIAAGTIMINPKKGQSRIRARKIKSQKSKGRRKGLGSKKGKKYSRITAKQRWMSQVRTQRTFVKRLKENNKVNLLTYRNLYSMIKNNRFRSIRLIKLYLEENKLFLHNGKPQKEGR